MPCFVVFMIRSAKFVACKKRDIPNSGYPALYHIYNNYNNNYCCTVTTDGFSSAEVVACGTASGLDFLGKNTSSNTNMQTSNTMAT